MSIDVRPLDDPNRWNDLLAESDTPTPFHHAGALDVLAEYAGADCHRLVGYKGQEPVGLFPVFTKTKGPVTAAFSPPPELKIPYLGSTLLNRQKLKCRRRDKRHRRFVGAACEWLSDEYAPKFTQIRTAPGYDDVRPFVWEAFDATPRYTYVVDLARGEDELLEAFSRDARQNVTDSYDVEYTIEEEGVEGIGQILERVQARHAEQDEPFPVSAPFVIDLYEALPEGVVRPSVCRIDGEFVGGSVRLEFDGNSINWLSGTKRDVGIPVNDLLDWRFVQDAIERGVDSYDLAGANNARIAKYKAKFAPSLVPYYRLQTGSRAMTAAAKLYNTFVR